MKMEEINNIMKLRGYSLANIEDYLVFYQDKDNKIKKIIVLEPDSNKENEFNIIDTVSYEDVEKVDTAINESGVDEVLSDTDLQYIEDNIDYDDKFIYLTENDNILLVSAYWGKYLYLNNKIIFAKKYIILEQLEVETVNE